MTITEFQPTSAFPYLLKMSGGRTASLPQAHIQYHSSHLLASCSLQGETERNTHATDHRIHLAPSHVPGLAPVNSPKLLALKINQRAFVSPRCEDDPDSVYAARPPAVALLHVTTLRPHTLLKSAYFEIGKKPASYESASHCRKGPRKANIEKRRDPMPVVRWYPSLQRRRVVKKPK